MTDQDIARLFGNNNPTGVGQAVTLSYGKATFSNTTATYAVMKVTPPFIRVTAVTSGKRIGGNHYTLVGQYEHNGGLSRTTVEHPNGTVLLLQVSWKRGGAPIRDGALFLRLRAGAPMIEVCSFLPLDHENMQGDRFVSFTGYADIMGAEELMLLGIQVPRMYTDKFMTMEELEECFSLRQLASETIGRPQLSAIATATGVELREVAAEPQRRMILRRKR